MTVSDLKPGVIKKCQICNSINLIEVMKLGNQPLANSLIKFSTRTVKNPLRLAFMSPILISTLLKL